jgi:hypothetical protein
MSKSNNQETLIPLLAEVVYMGELAKASGGDVGGRMRKSRDRRIESLEGLRNLDAAPAQALRDACANLGDKERQRVLACLIDNSIPFYPDAIWFDGDARLHAITGVAATIGVDSEAAKSIHRAWEFVDGQHRGVTTTEIVGLGLIVAVTVATAGAAAPAAAGLGGAAAVTASLAAIGGAVGGGMVAGTVALAVGGAIIAAGGKMVADSILAEIPSLVLAAEVRQTQIIVAGVDSDDPEMINQAKVGLEAIQKELEKRLAAEKLISDHKSPPVKEIEQALEVTETATNWIENPEARPVTAKIGTRKREFQETVKQTGDRIRSIFN